MSFQPSSSDVFIWPNGDWCYRYDDHSWRSDDFRVLGFGTCAFNALFEEFGGDVVAFLLHDSQKRIRRPTENQAVFMFTGPHGEYRRLCPALPSGLSCWVSLPGTWLKLPAVNGSNYGCFQSLVGRSS